MARWSRFDFATSVTAGWEPVAPRDRCWSVTCLPENAAISSI